MAGLSRSFSSINRQTISAIARKVNRVVLFNIIFAVIFGIIYGIIGMNDKHFYTPGEGFKGGFFDAIHFSFVTQSTSGYGSVSPKSGIARTINMFQLISIICSAAL